MGVVRNDNARDGGRPLTIGMIGWARLFMGASEGGGLNQVVTQLASGLVERGHRVVYLRSGLDYSLKSGMRIEAEEAWRGVECHTLINSPNLSIGHYNFENVREQMASPFQSGMVAEFLRRKGVRVLHIHAFEGVAFDLVEAVKGVGIPVVVTPHNYAALCPQIDLLHQERRVCDDYDGGRRCVDCLKVPDFRWEMRRRARVHTARRLLGKTVYEAIKPLGARVVRGVAGVLPRSSGRHEFESPASAGAGFAEELAEGAASAHQRLLGGKDHHLLVINEYGERRRTGVAALNRCDAVLAPGRFLRDVHAVMGVDASRLRQVKLGLSHIDGLRERARASADFDSPAWSPASGRPIRFVYFGNCWINKGLQVLVEAVAGMGDAERAGFELDIYASGDDRPFRNALKGFVGVRFHGAFGPTEQAATLDRADVGLFPGIALENSPLVIVEMLAAGRPVIASRRGAMEEFVSEGVNGWLFAPGDSRALAAAMVRVAGGEVAVPTRRAVQEASHSRTLPEFIEEMVGVYREFAGV